MSSVNSTNNSNSSYAEYLGFSNVGAGITSVASNVASVANKISSVFSNTLNKKTSEVEPYTLVNSFDDDSKDAVLASKYPLSFEVDALDVFRGYNKSEKIKLDEQLEIDISRLFLAEISRIGEPDRIFINNDEISAPLPNEKEVWRKNLLKKMYNISNSNMNKVSLWTKIWNFGLRNELSIKSIELVNKKYKFAKLSEGKPVIKSEIRLDTINNTVSVDFEFKVSGSNYADKTEPGADVPDVIEEYTFKTSASYKFNPESIEPKGKVEISVSEVEKF